MSDHRINGECLCGEVKFKTRLPHHIDACHCKMCQKWAGAVFVGADFRKADDVIFISEATLKWYESSDWAKRGFCTTCGSSLFYRLKDQDDFWAVCAGALDLPSGQTLGKEIFIDEKPDLYSLAGNHPKLTGAEFFAALEQEK